MVRVLPSVQVITTKRPWRTSVPPCGSVLFDVIRADRRSGDQEERGLVGVDAHAIALDVHGDRGVERHLGARRCESLARLYLEFTDSRGDSSLQTNAKDLRLGLASESSCNYEVGAAARCSSASVSLRAGA
jgi:hypothetical protein